MMDLSKTKVGVEMASALKAFIPFIHLCSLCFFISIEASQKYPQEQEQDRVFNLPGQPSEPSVSHFSGYITVHQDHGRALFYWFFEAQTQPSKKPLLLWLNGGPGCSSIGYGAAVELGPFKIKTNGTGLEFNKYAWNTEANLLFLESPIGVGFSYTNTSSDLSKLDDVFVADDAYNFLVNWLKRFPQYQAHDFYIAGESYAGHYVPQLAELVYDRNKDLENNPYINLKGFIVGNPETDDFYDTKGLAEYAWSHAVVSDQVYERINRVCNFKVSNWTRECVEAMNVVYQQYREIDIYNIYAPKCIIDRASSLTLSRISNSIPEVDKNGFGRMRIFGGYDPCFSTYAEDYFNRIDVQTSIHASTAGKAKGNWRVCNDSMLGTYNFTVFSVLPIYSKLVKAGLKIWVYSGDADGRVPVIGSRYCMEALGLPLKSQWHSWYHKNQVGGRFVEYEGLTLVTVRGAGHLVPLNKPSEALLLINSFLLGLDLPRQK
ncbi:serine carboxypeptidase-like protein 33 [Cinnamomum micranthum f. kanehirae]|uniref:Carboxypeptidase n=1 Tax=Cinnamomum micranthum f. kanehirae TaxID=337451 RepID=A0A443ND00_9MAGN|nr:serine carboxypeptidase-like protein 33 [Cinnamomum micranthum f. kanehirae]